MARKTVTPAPTFTAADYAVAVAAVVKAGNAIDKANANAAAHVSKWAIATAIGLKVQALTLDTAKAQLIAATPIATRKANVASGMADSVDVLNACGSTVKGWFYALNRIAKADALDRLIAGEAFNTLARAAKPVQASKRSKSAADVDGNTKPSDVKPVAIPHTAVGELPAAINALADRIKAASAKTLMSADCDAALASLMSALTAATAMVETAKRNATAPKAKATRKAA